MALSLFDKIPSQFKQAVAETDPIYMGIYKAFVFIG